MTSTHPDHPGLDADRPAERLLVLLSYVGRTAAEDAAARAAAAELSDWEELLDLAHENATAPLAHYALEELDLLDRVPAPVRARLAEAAAAIRTANEARLAVGRELFARFGDHGVPVVILKGILFAETIYKNPYYKKMNDIDILVRREDLDAVFDIYEELGFFSAAELVGGDPRKQEKFSHHAPPFFSRDLACMLGTHWGLITPLAPYTIDYDAIWSRVEDVDFYGSPAKAMAPEDNLHHLCVHLPYYKTGIRELADIYNLVRHHRDRLDWELLSREVEKAGTANLVYHALSLADRLCPLPEIAAAIRGVEPAVSGYYRRDTARKTASVSRLLRLRSVHMSRIEKAYGDLTLTSNAAEKREAWVRMWRNMLAPPLADVLKMNALDRASGLELLKARLATPLRIYRVFERDLGAKIFAAIVAKTAFEVVRDSVRERLAGTPGEDAQTRLDALGLSPEGIERLKEALE